MDSQHLLASIHNGTHNDRVPPRPLYLPGFQPMPTIMMSDLFEKLRALFHSTEISMTPQDHGDPSIFHDALDSLGSSVYSDPSGTLPPAKITATPHPLAPQIKELRDTLNTWALSIEPLSDQHLENPPGLASCMKASYTINQISHDTQQNLSFFQNCCIAVGALKALEIMMDKGWAPYFFREPLLAEKNYIYDIASLLGPMGLDFLTHLSEQGYELHRSGSFNGTPLIKALKHHRMDLVHYFVNDLKRFPMDRRIEGVLADFIKEFYSESFPTDFRQSVKECIVENASLFAQSYSDAGVFYFGYMGFAPALEQGDFETAEVLLDAMTQPISPKAFSSCLFYKDPLKSTQILTRYVGESALLALRDTPMEAHILSGAAQVSDPYDSQSTLHFYLQRGFNPRTRNEKGLTTIGSLLTKWPLERLQTLFQIQPDDVFASVSESQYAGENAIPSMARNLDENGNPIYWKPLQVLELDKEDLRPRIDSDRNALELLEFVKMASDLQSEHFFHKLLYRALNNALPGTFSFLLAKADELDVPVNHFKLLEHMSNPMHFPSDPLEKKHLEHCYDILLSQSVIASDRFLAAKQWTLQRLLSDAAGPNRFQPEFTADARFGRAMRLIDCGANPSLISGLTHQSPTALIEAMASPSFDSHAFIAQSCQSAFWTTKRWHESTDDVKDRCMGLISYYESLQLQGHISPTPANSLDLTASGTVTLAESSSSPTTRKTL